MIHHDANLRASNGFGSGYGSTGDGYGFGCETLGNISQTGDGYSYGYGTGSGSGCGLLNDLPDNTHDLQTITILLTNHDKYI